MTHKAFKLTTNNWSRDGTTYWYRCSAKKATSCTASETVKRVEERDENGSCGEELLRGGFHTRGVVFLNFKTGVSKIIVRFMPCTMPQTKQL